MIELDVENRILNLDISEEEIIERKTKWIPPIEETNRGYVKMYMSHVQQAEKGADFDVLVGGSGADVKRDLH